MAYAFNDDKSKVDVYSKDELYTKGQVYTKQEVFGNLITEVVTSNRGTISAGSTSSTAAPGIDVSKSGYTVIGVLSTSYSYNGNTTVILRAATAGSDGYAAVTLQNTGSASATSVVVRLTILYKKNV